MICKDGGGDSGNGCCGGGDGGICSCNQSGISR